MTTGGLSEQEIARFNAVAKRIVDLRNQITQLEERKAELTAELRGKLKVSDEVYTFDDATVSVTQTKVFSAEKARQLIAPSMLPLVEVTTTDVDDAKCRELLPPAIYKECRVPRGKPTVTVREKHNEE